MATLYPSWIEIPVTSLERALEFYRAVFELGNTPLYEDDPQLRIAVLLPSDKSTRQPGVSLVQSPQHTPCPGGAQVNFHVETHSKLAQALSIALDHGGSVVAPIVELSDGARYVIIRDSEGNTLALSSYEAPDGGLDEREIAS